MTTTYPVHWVQIPRKGRAAFLGICGYRRRAFTAAVDTLSVLVIRSLILTGPPDAPTQCEEGQGCLDRDCPLNRTTATSFMAHKGMTRGKVAFRKAFDSGETLVDQVNRDPHAIAQFERLCADHPTESAMVLRG